jgi:hypothetical protein
MTHFWNEYLRDINLRFNNENIIYAHFKFFVLCYYVSLRSEFRVVMSVTIYAYKRCSVRLYVTTIHIHKVEKNHLSIVILHIF